MRKDLGEDGRGTYEVNLLKSPLFWNVKDCRRIIGVQLNVDVKNTLCDGYVGILDPYKSPYDVFFLILWRRNFLLNFSKSCI